jgi:hypothetical protein
VGPHRSRRRDQSFILVFAQPDDDQVRTAFNSLVELGHELAGGDPRDCAVFFTRVGTPMHQDFALSALGRDRMLALVRRAAEARREGITPMQVETVPEEKLTALIDTVIASSDPELLDLALLNDLRANYTEEEAQRICYTYNRHFDEVQALPLEDRLHYLRYSFGAYATLQ